MKPLVVAVLGPTATGKSALALAIAERHGGEIINCEKFSPRSACPPDFHIWRPGHFSLVKSAD